MNNKHICFERLLPSRKSRINAAKTAIQENKDNSPPAILRHPDPLKLALLTDNKWAVGRIIEVKFMQGSPTQKRRVEEIAHKAEEFANLKFKFTDNPKAEIRITFDVNLGSWSYLGTDALSIPFDKQTLNFGWLYDDSPEEDYTSLVYHELSGHGWGFMHEHSSPTSKLVWNEKQVIEDLSGPPNFWTVDDIQYNVFYKYSNTVSQYSEFDPNSIMMYHFDKSWLLEGESTPFNTTLSDTDKKYLKKFYPFSDIPLDGRAKHIRIPKGSVKVLKLIVGPSDAGKYEVAVRPDINNWLSVLAQNGMKAYSKDAILMDLTSGQYTVKIRNSHEEDVFEVSVKEV